MLILVFSALKMTYVSGLTCVLIIKNKGKIIVNNSENHSILLMYPYFVQPSCYFIIK
jgi:hypothetical protein